MTYRCKQCGFVCHDPVELAAHQLADHALGGGLTLEDLDRRITALEILVGLPGEDES